MRNKCGMVSSSGGLKCDRPADHFDEHHAAGYTAWAGWGLRVPRCKLNVVRPGAWADQCELVNGHEGTCDASRGLERCWNLHASNRCQLGKSHGGPCRYHAERCRTGSTRLQCARYSGHDGDHEFSDGEKAWQEPKPRVTWSIGEVDDMIIQHGRSQAFAAGLLYASRIVGIEGHGQLAKVLREVATGILDKCEP